MVTAVFPYPKFLHQNIATLGLLIAVSFIGSAYAEDVIFGFAVGMGDGTHDRGHDIEVDALGNVYTIGRFEGTADFDPGVGTTNLVSAGGFDVFVQKLDSNGNYLWAQAIGGISDDWGFAVAIDGSGDVYITGYFQDTVDFEPGSGMTDLTSAGGLDIFLTKLSSAGNFIWAKAIGGTGDDEGNALAVDASGNVHTTGWFTGTVDFNPGDGSLFLSSFAGFDAFVQKLDSNGDFLWAKKMGGAGLSDRGYGVALNASGDVYTAGYFQDSVDFDPGPGTAFLTSEGDDDGFVQKLDSAGNFLWANRTGGSARDRSLDIAVDTLGNAYTTGYFGDTVDFDPGDNIETSTSAGDFDIFVQKLNPTGDFLWATATGGPLADKGYAIVVDNLGNVHTTGYFSQTVDFDPGSSADNLVSAGDLDIFVQKLDSDGAYQWAKSMGGTLQDLGYGIALDPSGNVFTTGWFSGISDFDPGTDGANLTTEGGLDIFVSKLARTRYLLEAWVDFGFIGSESGSEANPFDTLGEALLAATAPGSVKVKGDTGVPVTNDTRTIDQQVTLEAVNGTVRIGDPGSRSTSAPRSGFVSRH